jgi:hypothetical protein
MYIAPYGPNRESLANRFYGSVKRPANDKYEKSCQFTTKYRAEIRLLSLTFPISFPQQASERSARMTGDLSLPSRTSKMQRTFLEVNHNDETASR